MLFTDAPGKWSALFKPKLIQDLNSELELVKWPSEFSRTVPGLDHLANFKATELKNLLAYVLLPCTAPFMDDVADFWHWAAIFVHAIRLLSKPVVTVDDVGLAKAMISTWQRLLPILASPKSQSYNAHAVGHLPDQVNICIDCSCLCCFLYVFCKYRTLLFRK